MHLHILRLLRSPLRFMAFAALALCWATSHAKADFVIQGGHPRLWLTSARISQLRSFANRGTAHWQQFKYKLDVAMTKAPYIDDSHMCALAYQVTQDPKYARHAIDGAL